jgi:hypothetical protein
MFDGLSSEMLRYAGDRVTLRVTSLTLTRRPPSPSTERQRPALADGEHSMSHPGPHPAIEEFDRRYIGTSLEPEHRSRRFWPQGTEALYGERPEYLAPGPEYGPQYRPDHSGRGPRGYQRPVDRILEDVVEVLTREPELDASDIDVQVNEERDVTLTGDVTYRADKRLAEDLAADVRGVKDVHNRIRLRRGR